MSNIENGGKPNPSEPLSRADIPKSATRRIVPTGFIKAHIGTVLAANGGILCFENTLQPTLGYRIAGAFLC